MRRIWKIRGLALLLIGGALATFAWGETVELVTYFPTTSQAGNLGVSTLTVGDAIGGVDLDDGELLVLERVGINVDVEALGPEVRLVVGGGDHVASQALFLPGAGGSFNVGIGTATPADTLTVFDRTDSTISLIRRDDTDSSAFARWSYNGPIVEFGPVQHDNLAFLTDNQSRLFIHQDGNIGIWTEDPIVPLHSFGIYVEPGGDVTAVNPHHRASAVFDGMSEDINRGYSSTYTGGLTNFIALSYNDQPGARLGFYANAINGTITNSKFYINTNPNTILATNSPSFVITDTGDVGIGEPDPSAFTAPNGRRENLIVANDVYLRAADKWVSQLGGGEFRLMRGSVTSTGVITAGSGFSVRRLREGQYRITFTTSFSSQPSALVSIRVDDRLKSRMGKVRSLSTTQLLVYVTSTERDYRDFDFDFLVIGPR